MYFALASGEPRCPAPGAHSILVVEAEALAGGLELCAARVLNADLEASRPILIKPMIHAPPNAHGRRGRAPQEAGRAAGWVAARPEDRRAGAARASGKRAEPRKCPP
jgi:hypothetical protein